MDEKYYWTPYDSGHFPPCNVSPRLCHWQWHFLMRCAALVPLALQNEGNCWADGRPLMMHHGPHGMDVYAPYIPLSYMGLKAHVERLRWSCLSFWLVQLLQEDMNLSTSLWSIRFHCFFPATISRLGTSHLFTPASIIIQSQSVCFDIPVLQTESSSMLLVAKGVDFTTGQPQAELTLRPPFLWDWVSRVI